MSTATSESGDDLTVALERWELSGGLWRVLGVVNRKITVGFYTCSGGEEMSRVSGLLTPSLEDYLAGRSRSDE